MQPAVSLIAGAVLSALLCSSAIADDAQTDSAGLTDRAARGNIVEPGGARRLSGDQTAALKASLSDKTVKNVILLIGDGMGDSEITSARNYAEGAGGYFKGIDALPLTGQYTHYSLDKKSHKPDYVTDSAASATAWSTGVKTYNGALGVDVNGKDHSTLLEIAKAAGKATGNVSTAELQDATPAAQVSHVTSRKCYGPLETSEKCAANALENGGRGSITEQLLKTRADVTLGGGAKSFNQQAKSGEWQGKTLKEQATAQGYQWVSDADGLQAVTLANQQKPLLGLFADGNMPVRWQGPKASYHGNIDKPAVTCENNPARTAATPTLAAMTEKAIDLLKTNPNGFFLQVEGASIDKQDHEANPCGQFGETVDLDEAVQKALAFARADGNTLVIVTADHAHSSQIIAADAKAPGLTQTLTTKDGAPMTISYGNSEEGSQGHTGTQLRVAAYGPHAANVVGLTDQTDLFFTMRDAMGIK
ncbi:alkaline phosphatase [Serratia entomophila]|uniref:alkaline phosphatase n=1 Tax=Serratia entomophila TaxID=42906 RepID=UPI00217875B5|nr:alkaline phosphatase [Serratia entomophila]CAI1115595.1 Alkaline phosphatase precursor [Serratia entomophila]CAI1838628.1 Alkaline phosphatase precursor [Serratia entomophila]CAI1848302.1 Alkaline phosphatase precursor [Serratia entomophila]CAI1896506.1 Alkaline phosphatase precursor [Serratia entomophila]CAI1928793.1 Alkaline phosphatase precursor [Serratia entomophila]